MTTTHPKYQGIKIKQGMYLQPHDDGTSYSVIVRVPYPDPDGRDKMCWFFGEITRAEIESIQRQAADPFVTDGDLLYQFESYATDGPWDTKREAIQVALGLAVTA